MGLIQKVNIQKTNKNVKCLQLFWYRGFQYGAAVREMSKYYLTGRTTINLGGIPMEWDGVCGHAYIIAVVDYGKTHKNSMQDFHMYI